MATVNWTAGSGHKIEVAVNEAFDLDSQGRRKTSGRKLVVLTVTVNGEKQSGGWLQTTDHPVAVAKIGNVGLTAENYNRVKAAVAQVESEIAAHNAACDAHEDTLNLVTDAGRHIANAMKAGE